MADEINKTVKRVCVTGAGGYIGSWLVKNLLERGYTVNATLRDPGDEAKSGPLLELAGAEERLKLFKADLCLEGSFDSPAECCEGFFHVASPMDFTKANPTVNTAWYTIAKTLAEQEAFKYGLANNIEVVSILPALVIGPWFTSTPAFTSAQTILALIGGSNECYELLKFLDLMLGSIPIVHIDDTCNAHIFLMEHTNAQNRYICASDSMSLKCLKDFLAEQYVQLKNSLKLDEDDGLHRYLPTSSKKLLDMGFSFKYHLKEAFEETIECVIKNGLLKL